MNEGGRVIPVNELADHKTLSTNLPVPERALAVGAHPDDIEFGCGATLAKWAALGCAIHHVVLTDGSKGTWDPSIEPERLIAQRQNEQLRAAQVLGGGDVRFLGRPDGELRNGVTEQWEVARWVRELRPDVVLGHDPWRRYRLHPDHRYAGFVLTDAIVAARDPTFFADQELPSHRPSAMLLWEADEVNHVEDVDGYADTKIAALLAHESQHQSSMGIAGTTSAESFADMVRRQLADHGAVGGLALGEAFHCITEI